jgi:hypothetical protein
MAATIGVATALVDEVSSSSSNDGSDMKKQLSTAAAKRHASSRPSAIARSAAVASAPKVAKALASAKKEASTRNSTLGVTPLIARATVASSSSTTTTSTATAMRAASKSSAKKSLPKTSVGGGRGTGGQRSNKQPISKPKGATPAPGKDNDMCLHCQVKAQNKPHWFCSRRCGLSYAKLVARGQCEAPPLRINLPMPVANYTTRSSYEAVAAELVRLLLPSLPSSATIRAIANATVTAPSSLSSISPHEDVNDDNTGSNNMAELSMRVPVTPPIVASGLSAPLLDIIAGNDGPYRLRSDIQMNLMDGWINGDGIVNRLYSEWI